MPVEEVLSDEDLFRVGLQFMLSDDRWEDLSDVGWEPGERRRDRNQENSSLKITLNHSVFAL